MAPRPRTLFGKYEDPLTIFEDQRPKLLTKAYRILGCHADAEDIVQDTYLRWHLTEFGEIESPHGWLSTACVRLSIDRGRAAHRVKELSASYWIDSLEATNAVGGSRTLPEIDEALSAALQRVMERLSPLERAAFLLRDIFGYEYSELAAKLERSQTACRQLVSRARRNAQNDVRFRPAPGEVHRLLRHYTKAVRCGAVEDLEAVLLEDLDIDLQPEQGIPAGSGISGVNVRFPESTLPFTSASVPE